MDFLAKQQKHSEKRRRRTQASGGVPHVKTEPIVKVEVPTTRKSPRKQKKDDGAQREHQPITAPWVGMPVDLRETEDHEVVGHGN